MQTQQRPYPLAGAHDPGHTARRTAAWGRAQQAAGQPPRWLQTPTHLGWRAPRWLTQQALQAQVQWLMLMHCGSTTKPPGRRRRCWLATTAPGQRPARPHHTKTKPSVASSCSLAKCRPHRPRRMHIGLGPTKCRAIWAQRHCQTFPWPALARPPVRPWPPPHAPRRETSLRRRKSKAPIRRVARPVR